MKTIRRLVAVGSLAIMTACAASNPPEPGDPRPTAAEIGAVCGGAEQISCRGDHSYCRFEPGACVDQANPQGTCAEKPQVCTMDYTPVCGCDGQTYSNECTAAGQGVSVATQGECS